MGSGFECVNDILFVYDLHVLQSYLPSVVLRVCFVL